MFEKRELAEEHKVKTGETLESLAAQAKITWQRLAEFNWGTSSPKRINEHLADDVGCTKRTAGGNFMFDDTDDPGIILIPKKFRRAGLPARQVHTMFVLEKEDDERLLDCFGLPGATFRFGRSFIRPPSSEFIVEILNKADEFPQATLCVFGHTDAADDVSDNKRLSERRAWALWAVLVHNPNAWVVLRDHRAEKWDEREFRRVHEAIGSTSTGTPGGPEFNEYFKVLRGGRDPLPQSRFLYSGAVEGFMGCGEYNHLVKNERPFNDPVNQAKNEPNRRVVVFFFDSRKPPRLPCQYNNIGPCVQNGAREDADRGGGKLFSCAVYDRIARDCDCEFGNIIDQDLLFDLRYQVNDPRGKPIADRNYALTLSDNSTRKGKTDGAGFILELDVPPRLASLQLEGYSHIDEDLADNDVPPEWADESETGTEGETCGL